MISALDHISLIVSDLEVADRFYGGVLGLDKLARPEFSFPGLWFSAGNIQIHLILETDLSGPAGIRLNPDARVSRHLHFAFQVQDFQQACRLFQQDFAVSVVDGPKQRPDGIRQLFIQDPDGHVLELCEPGN